VLDPGGRQNNNKNREEEKTEERYTNSNDNDVVDGYNIDNNTLRPIPFSLSQISMIFGQNTAVGWVDIWLLVTSQHKKGVQ
jgi:hypothetical protein